MRLIQLLVPAGDREMVVDTLEAENVDYVITDETSGREFEAVVYFPLPVAAVEPILDRLEARGISEETYTVVVDAETVISERFEALRDEYEEENVESGRISRQELRAQAEDLTPQFGVYTVLTVVSALVATAGLLLNSPAVVVGSMVIAPLLGPALAATVGTVLDEHDLLRQGIKYQLLGVVIAIASAAVFAWLIRVGNVAPPIGALADIDEVAERLAPDLLSLVIALGAGVAGILSIATGVPVALVGVMIAAAIIPPAATAGITLAYGDPMAALGPTTLVFVNLLSINIAGLVTLRYAGYRPGTLIDIEPTGRRVRHQLVLGAVAILVLSSLLVGVTYSAYQADQLEQEATTEVETLLAAEGAGYELIDLRAVRDGEFPFQGVDRVVVRVGVPPDHAESGLTDAIHERVVSVADGSVPVEVQYVDVVTA